MNRRRWLIGGMLGGFAWIWLGLGLAQAGTIAPTDPTTKLLLGAPVSVSLYQLDSTPPSALTLKSPSRCTTTGTSFYKDVTDCWLPEWDPANGGKSVFVVINGSTDTPTLVSPVAAMFPLASGAANPFLTALTTSAYPGQCTNFGSSSDTGSDFTLLGPQTLTTSNGSVVGYELKPNDCGGMAVIQVGSRTFLLPKDGTATVPANGLPEVWENLYGGGLDPATDIDTGPAATSPCCDGISTGDEYRGFIVSGQQVRTDPKQKDLFLHVVNPADSAGGVFVGSTSCPPLPGQQVTSCWGGGTTTYPAPTAPNATLTVPATAGTLRAIVTFTTSSGVFSNAHVRGEIIGNAGGRATIVTVTGPTSATAEITQAFPPTSLSPGFWKVSESLFALVYTLVAPERLHLLGYAPGATNLPTTNEWVDNFVSLVPAQTLTVSNSVTDRTVNVNRLYGPAQKGVRVMEGLNTASSSVLGFSIGVNPPNTAGNTIVFTQRIINYITGLIGTSTTLKYSTASLVNGTWTWSTPSLAPDGDTTISQDGVATNAGVRAFVLSKAFQFYTAHEINHSLDLVNQPTSYGNHFAPGTGDCLDQAITAKAKSGTATFSIPSVCGTADQAQFVIR